MWKKIPLFLIGLFIIPNIYAAMINTVGRTYYSYPLTICCNCNEMGISGQGIGGYLAKWDNPSNLSASLVYQNESYIGIWTTQPTQVLDVNGSINVSETLYASNISSNSPLQLQTQGITRIYINDTTGKVQIIGNNPGEPILDVQNTGTSGFTTAIIGNATFNGTNYTVGVMGIVNNGWSSSGLLGYSSSILGISYGVSSYCQGMNCYTFYGNGGKGLKLDSGDITIIAGLINISNNAYIYHNGSASFNITTATTDTIGAYALNGIGLKQSGGVFASSIDNTGLFAITKNGQYSIYGSGGTIASIYGVSTGKSIPAIYGHSSGTSIYGDLSLDSAPSGSKIIYGYAGYDNKIGPMTYYPIFGQLDNNGAAIYGNVSTTNGYAGYFNGGQGVFVNGIINTTNNIYENNSRVCTVANGLCTGMGNTSSNGITGYIPQFENEILLNNSIIFQNKTNIGIGTTTPISKLDISGNVTIGNITGTSQFANDGSLTFTGTAQKWKREVLIVTQAGYATGFTDTIFGESYAPAEKAILGGRTYFMSFANTYPGQDVGAASSWQYVVPYDRVNASIIKIKVHWMPADATIGNVLWRLGERHASNGQSYAQPETIQNLTITTPGTALQREEFEFNITNIGNGDHIDFTIARDGEDTTDTYQNNVYISDIEVWYLSDRIGIN